jgi:hypothetical protein
MNKNFQIGDIVECIECSPFLFLQLHKKYIVHYVVNEINHIKLKEIPKGYYSAQRFRLVSRTKLSRLLYE